MKQLKPSASIAYALLRIVSGFMFSLHGVQKLFGVLTTFQPPLFSQLWFGGIIELVCGLAIMLGFRTRWVAFLASGQMAVAYFQFHWKFQMGVQMLPGVNNGELAVLYCFVFLLILAMGSGRWAVDKN
jgi:putative oxidoreductase